MQYYLGFDIGGSSTKVGVVTDDKQVIYHEKQPHPDTFEGMMQMMADVYTRLKKEYPICGIGISSCGLYRPGRWDCTRLDGSVSLVYPGKMLLRSLQTGRRPCPGGKRTARRARWANSGLAVPANSTAF